MHKIIFDNFEFDLTPYNISIIENNYWFSEKFIAAFSFPFSFLLTDELKLNFGDVLDSNSRFMKTSYQVVYVFGNQIEEAAFEIEGKIGDEVEARFSYGFEEFPNWNKKLRDFNFPTIDTSDIYESAKTHLDANTTNLAINNDYEFPFIHTNRYDTTEPTWSGFLGGINNFDKQTDEFIRNTNLPDDFNNRNIMQPCLSWYYILKLCIEESGFNFTGTLINDSLFQKMLLYAPVDYFKIKPLDNIVVDVLREDFINETADARNFNSSYKLEPSRKYIVEGGVVLKKNNNAPGNGPWFGRIEYNGRTVFETTHRSKNYFISQAYSFVIQTTDDENIDHTISFVAKESKFGRAPRSNTVFRATLKNEVEGEVVDLPDEIINSNTINLKEALPDVTFGDVFSAIRKMFNVDRKLDKNTLYLNLIEDQINYNNATDLRKYEVLKPAIKSNSLKSTILKYKNENSFVFADNNSGRFYEGEVFDADQTIEINVTVLPSVFINFRYSAFASSDLSNQDLCVLLYDSRISKQQIDNSAVSSFELNLYNIYARFYEKWFDFLLNSISYRWVFKMYLEELNSIQKKIFAYDRYHVVKSIDKTQIAEDLFEVEIETATII